ncbi:MAG: acyltransferase domain-containing protein [Victivallales bacterium]|nr:acyltransferase domain-containing protein [Victivallales bacterium]
MDVLEDRLKQMTPLQRAVVALKETQARLEALEQQRDEPIAIVGMACRFPGGADDPDSYWRLLRNGVDAIREIPAERWDVDSYYDPDSRAPGKMNTRWGGFLDGVAEFDNHFFGISEREATQMDPQHRLVLELAWEALEDAGLPPSRLRGSRTGVFIGLSHSEYGIMLSSDLAQTDAFVGTGTAHCIAANRVSFLFGLCGPSLTLDAACSSSLVSVHMACRSLRCGESELALAGGVSLILSPLGTVNLTKAGFSAPDGRVRAFDAKASGYVRGEGAGMVVLKPLAAARRDGDRVYAVIRGSAVNQNGASNGLTAPSGKAQERMLRDAYAQAKVTPGKIGYVETQGTGTALGDTIEALALGNVLREGRAVDQPCAIGSVKTSIGHLEAASGIASLMKAVLALEHQQFPPSLHFETPNPNIPFADLPLKVQTQLAPWPESGEPRLAGVSAFGFGGSNAHVVLTEPPAAQPPPAAAGMGLLPLSARTDAALRDLASRYVGFLRGTSLPWLDICATAGSGRDHHDCRLAVLASTPASATDLLAVFLAGQDRPELVAGRKPWGQDLHVAFLYSGETDPWCAGVPRLAAEIPGFVAAMAGLDGPLQRVAALTADRVLHDAAVWEQPSTAWPSLVAVQLALTAWWRTCGVGPQVAVGRGLGELAAAAAAGILEVDEALRLAAALASGDGARAVGELTHREAVLPFVSGLDGHLYRGRDLLPDHWLHCGDACGDWESALVALGDRRPDVWLHIGSGSLDCPEVVVAATLGSDGENLGGAAVGALYAAGVDIDWPGVFASDRCPVRLPTYPWQRHRLWAERKDWLAGAPPSGADATAIPTSQDPGSPVGEPVQEANRPRPDLAAPYVGPGTALEEVLAQAWTEILRLDRVGVHDNFFELGGDSLQAMMLHNLLQEQLGEVVYGYVLFQAQTVGELADYLRGHYAATIQRLYPGEPQVEIPAPAADVLAIDDRAVAGVRRLVSGFVRVPGAAVPVREKNPRAVFILAPPRSGSTLLRVMLAGHEGIFAPPELELLGFDSVADQQAAYAGVPGNWLEGFVRAVMEVSSCGVDEARRTIREWADSGLGVQEAYRWLQASIGERLLVDKTPSYSGWSEVLGRAEQLFDSPLYIHLMRHPCGMIRSYVEANLHEETQMRFGFGGQAPFPPRQMAELVWTIGHQNIVGLLAGVPAERQHRLRFEDLVRRPEQAMREVCRFLGLEFRGGMILPYEHPERKMVDGVTAQDRMSGDQKFLFAHKAIDPAVADAWKQHLASDILGPPARQLAADFGYEHLGEAPAAMADGPTSLVTPANQDDAEALLGRLDELSDDEVATLLHAHLDDEDTHD